MYGGGKEGRKKYIHITINIRSTHTQREKREGEIGVAVPICRSHLSVCLYVCLFVGLL